MTTPCSFSAPIVLSYHFRETKICPLRACFKVLAGKRSYLHTLDQSSSSTASGGMHSVRRDAQLREGCTMVKKEGDTRLASQISRIKLGYQWGTRCLNQIALTSTKWCDALLTPLIQEEGARSSPTLVCQPVLTTQAMPYPL